MSLVGLFLRTNRATRAVGEVLSQHRFGYLISLVVVVTLVSAAGVSFFEQDEPDSQLRDFGDALWWSATMVTTINLGSDPFSVEGKVLALALRVFSVAVFGYVAASIAAYFVGQRVESRDERPTQQDEQMREVLRRLEELQRQVRRLERGGDDQQLE